MFETVRHKQVCTQGNRNVKINTGKVVERFFFPPVRRKQISTKTNNHFQIMLLFLELLAEICLCSNSSSFTWLYYKLAHN